MPGCNPAHGGRGETRSSGSTIHREKKMNIIIWLIAGAAVGYVASLIMKTNSQQGLGLDIVVGVIGAFIAGYFLTPMFGISTINQNNFSLPALLVSLLGAVILLALVRVFNRSRAR
jgi:uncharacterized membrane protein YeaQ/YmgE (transglycosylase-associated protein family)